MHFNLEMRKAYTKMWRAVPCGNHKSFHTEDIDDILNAKLATIMEEPETSCDHDNPTPPPRHWRVLLAKKAKTIRFKNRIRCLVLPQFSIKESYALFVTGFATKGTFGGLLQY